MSANTPSRLGSDPAARTNVDELDALKDLTENIRDQGDLDCDIIAHAETAMQDEEDRRDEARIKKSEEAKRKLQAKVDKLRDLIAHERSIGRTRQVNVLKAEADIEDLEEKIQVYNDEIALFRQRIDKRHLEPTVMASGGIKLPGESTRDYLIRTGKITPFANVPGELPAGIDGGLAEAVVEAEAEAAAAKYEAAATDEPISHQNLRRPGFASPPREPAAIAPSVVETEFSLRPRKKRKVPRPPDSDDDFNPDDDYAPASSPPSVATSGTSDLEDGTLRRRKRAKSPTEEMEDLSHVDDGNEAIYQKRLKIWCDARAKARRDHSRIPIQSSATDNADEWYKPHPVEPDYVLDAGLKLPGDIHKVLFNYQKTGVHWLCELYHQKVGGILGDEMGLGKTVQAISFVAALHYSKKLDKPAIVVVPATLMRQWVNEFHQWWPALRVSIMHSSGSGMINVRNERRMEDEDIPASQALETEVAKAAKRIIKRVVKNGHVLITTYAGLQTYAHLFNEVEWGYAILDEGHKIRNPNTAVTITCKQLKTPHRLILSGTPMQNSLQELWSVFDFVYPFRLGTLWNFRDQFDIPIKQGGYATASNLQIMTAQKCAEVLKDIVSPYLLQRVKADVAQDLPKKTEQVLFCKLTDTQREIYQRWIDSEQRDLIIQRKMNSLVGIDTLRKICNHPDLTRKRMPGQQQMSYGEKWGDPELSGKMKVVQGLLQLWKGMSHKCLLFCQGVQMLNILQELVVSMDGLKYLRMDGTTPVKRRQLLVDQFNNDPEIHVFLLTTKVGGLGLNLIGASRVILFDPDWNPSTDAQAQERAWRLGQKKDVQIYRLLTAGTIEEKIYQRQIFKTVLTNKVLKDPSARSNFDMGDLEDLFTMGRINQGKTETGNLFKGSERTIKSAHDSKATRDAPNTPGDVNAVVGVTNVEDYDGDLDTATTQEDRIMEGLFSRSGVTSTLKHEKIVNGRTVKVNAAILEKEARDIANRARSRLNDYREEARSIPIGTVTWTGEFGSAGHPGNNTRRGRAGPSSSAITGASGGVGSSRSGGAVPPGMISHNGRPANMLRKADFIPMITQFIRNHGNKAPSKTLVDHFNAYTPTDKQVRLFKSALYEVAVLEDNGGGPRSSLRNFWRLRTDDDE